jgi:DNA-binding transcriptional MerR regulator
VAEAGSRHGEFSQSAVRRAVLRETVSHPASVYPAVLAALGAVAVGLFGWSNPLLWGASGAGAVGLLSWLVNYFARSKSFAGRYLERAHRALEERTRSRLEQLERELAELGLERGVHQLDAFGAKLANLKEILRRVLDVNELTYGRYLGIAEQVYLSAIDNLHEAALARQAIATIDLSYIDARLRELEKGAAPHDEAASEIESLRARRELHAEQLAKVEELLAQNEVAMTQMDVAAAAIAAIKTGPRSARVDFETAMSELTRLADTAQRYSLP